VAVKKIEGYGTTGNQTYEKVHVSFQSTSSCNISSINSMNQVKLYVCKKERGRVNHKCSWAIEMNETRDLYLGSYEKNDTIDSLLRKASNYYRYWKY